MYIYRERLRVEYCLLTALDAQLFSLNGYGPGHKSNMAEHMCIKGNRQAINRQYIIGNI